MKTRLVRRGNSHTIRLPRALLKKAKLGNEVRLQAEPGRIMITRAMRPRAGWAEAAQRMRARDEDRLFQRDEKVELHLGILAGQANKALARMVRKLDKAHTTVSSLRKSLAARKR